jgi:hypothetical protein
MKCKRFWGAMLIVAVGAAMIEPPSVKAQSADDMNRLWCIQRRDSIVRNYQAVERMRARHQAGIDTLRAEHQVPATRNLNQWYWKKVEDLFAQRRALDAECAWMNIRPDAPSPGRVAPLPRPRQPRPTETWSYPPYERYPEPSDPFSPGRR